MRKLRKLTRKNPYKKRKTNKTYKKAGNKSNPKIYTIPNKTSEDILSINFSTNNKSLMFESPLTSSKSYAPSINRELVTLKSISRNEIGECNNKAAFLLKEPLQIKISGQCYPYQSLKAQEFLLNNLRANKHLNINKMITPVQSHSNCWFNTMFVAFFMSDSGRKFFHFFRQLMIQGKQSDGKSIPSKLWDSFSLLNFAIESCLTGNKYAYILDTNSIIRHIFLSIPDSYKKKESYLVDVDYANNPIYYYNSLMDYLNVNKLSSIIVPAFNENWKNEIKKMVDKETHAPHFIVMEIFDGNNKTPGYSGEIINKETSFSINDYTYELDSCIIRDIGQQHFTAVLTCEGKEMAYDGASFHRIVPMKWKQLLNKDSKWKFKGTEQSNGTPLYWSFRHGYQMLFYYRTK